MTSSPGNTNEDPLAARKRRLNFRASHRGTKEADILIGGFCARHSATWGDAEIAWFESLLEETDVDIMAWAIGTQPVPTRYAHEIMEAMQRLDYLNAD